MKLVIPDNNDPGYLDMLIELLDIKSRHKIFEVYGKPTANLNLGSGRWNKIEYDRINTVERIRRVQELGVGYNYVINDILPRASISANRVEIIDELIWIEASSINKVTLANYELALLAEKYCPSAKLNISVYAEVKNLDKLNQWLELKNISSIYVDKSVQNKLHLLENMISAADKKGVKIRLIANLGCMSDCIRSEEHAMLDSLTSTQRDAMHKNPCSLYCLGYLYQKPERFLGVPIIIPEGIDRYENIGVDAIKIVDRSRSTAWIRKVVGHYLSGKYEGNILDLTCNFTTLENGIVKDENIEKMRAKDYQSKEGIAEYRRILPAMMDVRIEAGKLNYDKERREKVLKFMDQMKDHLFS